MKDPKDLFDYIAWLNPKPVNIFDKFMEVGVTRVTEKSHDLITIELILEGDFKDEDIALLCYKYSPSIYLLVGDTECTIETEQGTIYTARFTRRSGK